MAGRRPVAASFLTYPPVRGHVWTDYTCCARSHRGRGIGRAVKMETIAQAVQLGVPRLRTLNDSENAPILHINQTLGYEPIPGPVEYVKPAVRPG
jgi:GNAT superfamily N-acetyltransferase